MKYYLDYDRVIFDTDAYYRAVDERGLTDIVVHPDVWDICDSRDFLYKDALDFLKNHDRSHITIVTAMSPEAGPFAREFQKRNVNSSGVPALVGNIVFMEGLKGVHIRTLSNGEPAVFVDDKLEQVASVHSECPHLTVVQMVRNTFPKELQVKSSAFPVITSFAELDAILSLP